MILLAFSKSSVSPLAPRRSKLHIACSDFFKSERAHSAAPPFQPRFASLDSRLGFWCRLKSLRLESIHAFHLGASCISLAPTFFKSKCAYPPCSPLSDAAPWGSVWFMNHHWSEQLCIAATQRDLPNGRSLCVWEMYMGSTGGESSMAYTKVSRTALKSAMMSSGSSRPTLMRTRPSEIPAVFSSSEV